ncbi:hypothetical protein [Amycolatopsis sp. NPDC051128]|uniref:hypothetical protein n=1 Tax=Amycolatopsis sp. NPDC051128 TaxID=3155412 RepID=UPI003436DAAA
MIPDADLDQLREIFEPLVCDVDSDAFPVITGETLAARVEAAACTTGSPKTRS